MLIAEDFEEAQQQLYSKIRSEGIYSSSRYGDTKRVHNSFVVVKNPDFKDPLEPDSSGWKLGNRESYLSRIEGLLDIAARKLEEVEFTRRVSLPVWRPWDHSSSTPPAITEVSCLVVNHAINLTAFIRSFDVINYFQSNGNFLAYLMEYLVDKTSYKEGTIGMIIGVPHYYLRDENRLSESQYEEVYGTTPYGTHLKERYLSSAWHQALHEIYNNGMKKSTEWGELFEGQSESRYIHRLMIEVDETEEHDIHDKAPFSRDYGVDYAHEYLICAGYIDKRVETSILKEGEVYSYAERARYCEMDDQKVDQLYESLLKLKKDRWRRDAYVGISRPWDLDHDDPPCLRGYMFYASGKDELTGLFYMRSNDAYGAMHANMFGFNILTRYVRELTGFNRHKLVHFALDAHIYGEFYNSVKDLLYPDMPSFSEEIASSR
jgi:thymidylate synthase